ncbi:MAG: SDR family oxidoreductase [Betaproteobacteria bacterium]
MTQYAGKTIVVTGASDGIGAELARQLAADKPRLVLAARNAAGLEAVAAQCRALGAEALVVPTDVGEREQCERLIAAAAQVGGGIDVLIHNVGVSTHASLADALDHGMFERVLRVNLMGSVWCTRAALASLKARRGRILAVCSLAGRLGIAHRTAYCASKFAQDGFFQALRAELEGSGVSVTIAYPGLVATGFAAHSLDAQGRAYGQWIIKRNQAMAVEDCAARILAGLATGKAEVVLTGRGRLALWLKLLSPSLVDRLTRSTVKKAKSADRVAS